MASCVAGPGRDLLNIPHKQYKARGLHTCWRVVVKSLNIVFDHIGSSADVRFVGISFYHIEALFSLPLDKIL